MKTILLFSLILTLICLLQGSLAADASSSSSNTSCEHGYQCDIKKTIEGLELEITKERIGNGRFGDVYHAYRPSNGHCFAVKISYFSKDFTLGINREIDILKYFNGLHDNERNYIIKMYKHEEKTENDESKMFIVLELGGKNLKDYFHQTIRSQGSRVIGRTHEELLTKILRGATLALQQFHQHGIHLDVKYENFITSSLQPNPNDHVIGCKLIDFNISVLADEDDNIIIEGGAHFNYMAKWNRAPEIHNINDEGSSQSTNQITRKADI